MQKIASISPKGVPSMTVYYDKKAKTNPYRVYKEWNEVTEYGIRHRKKLVIRYADLLSCAHLMLGYISMYNEEGRG